LNTVFPGESFFDTLPVFPAAFHHIAGYSDVQRSIAFVCKNVDAWLFRVCHSWIPAFAGMTELVAGMTMFVAGTTG